MTRLEIVADQGRRLRTGTNAAQPEEADTAPGSRGWAAEKPRSVARLRGRARSAYAWLLWAPSRTAAAMRRLGARGRRRMRALGNDEAGAVTAEYAIVIMAAVVLGGVLVTIVRSPEIRQQLMSFISSALSGDM